MAFSKITKKGLWTSIKNIIELQGLGLLGVNEGSFVVLLK